MKKMYKISLSIIAVLVALVIFSIIFPGGKSFWKQTVVLPIVKPFSEPCGYGGTSGKEVECVCDGSLFADVRLGSTNYYCTGSCRQCKCFSVNLNDGTKKEKDCATFSQLD